MNATLDLARPALTELLLALLDRGKQVRIAVGGTSMEPVICNGDVVILAAAPAEAICRGDLLLCRTSTGGLVLHRLMRAFGARSSGRLLQTRGDAMLRLDLPVREQDVLARAIAVERSIDGRVEQLQTWRGRLRARTKAWLGLARSYLHYRVSALVRKLARTVHRRTAAGADLAG